MMWRILFLLAVLMVPAAAAEPVKLHPRNPHYFLFRGQPLVIVTSAEHYGAVLNLDFDYKRYLATLQAGGMNYTRIFTGSYVEMPGAFGIKRNTLAPAQGRFQPPWARSATPGYAFGGNRFDLSRWNPDYFARLKDFVALASQYGIVVEVTLFCATYTEDNWKLHPFHPQNNVNGTRLTDWKKLSTPANEGILEWQEKLTRKIVTELNEFDNVIFEIQNEPWADQTVVADHVNPYLRGEALDRFPNTADLATEESAAWQALVAGWIRDTEARLPNKHLIAQNYCNFRFPVRRLAPGVDIVNFHYAYPEAVYWNYGWNLPVGYDETGFLGHSDEIYRKQAWNFLLAGGGLFNHLDYSFTVGKEDGTDTGPNGPGGGSPALRKQFRILHEFLTGFDFLSMAPDLTTVKLAPGLFTRALSQPGRQYAIYITGAEPGELRLSLPAGSYRARWLNPQTGAVEKEESVPAKSGVTVLRTPPFSVDIALSLTRAQR